MWRLVEFNDSNGDNQFQVVEICSPAPSYNRIPSAFGGNFNIQLGPVESVNGTLLRKIIGQTLDGVVEVHLYVPAGAVGADFNVESYIMNNTVSRCVLCFFTVVADDQPERRQT